MIQAQTIPLARDVTAKVDFADWCWLSRWRWYLSRPKSGYVCRRPRGPGGRQVALYMHRLIAGATEGVAVDHIDGDNLNNKRNNLRLCSLSENQGNRGKSATNTSGFKGVWLDKRLKTKPWVAQVGRKKLGCFATPEDAALAYDAAARVKWGAFAQLNFSGDRGAA